MAGGKWKKGESGNPTGRPKLDPGVSALAKAEAPEAFRRIVEISKNCESDKVKLAACIAIIERAYGKVPQPLDHSGFVAVHLETNVSG